MANILPVSDLRNYNEVLKNCRKGEPVYLTKNGRGRFVVMDIEDYVIIYKVGNEYVEIYRVINRYQDITRVFD